MSWAADPGPKEPRRLGESLEQLVRSMGAPSMSALEKIFGNWESIVGSDVARHSRPVRLEGHQLMVAVEDGAWASQLRWMTDEVLKALDRELGAGTVSHITVRVAPDPK